MYFLKLTILLALVATLVTAAKDETKSRGKRQQIAFYPRRGPRPPPYAVQMEPIVQYSQRDPLYNPLAISKSDDGFYDEGPLNYYPTEPEPIIEIIIKESNESLPTPVPPPTSPRPRPTKEPIQVFYVKYEKKKGYGDSKPRVVYDPPVPAVTPVEDHEEIHPEHSAPHDEEPIPPATPAPSEPSTTLRTIIRPDSEVYHAGSSGIRVTFGTDQVPPNHHNKRSDHDAPTLHPPLAPPAPTGGSSSKRREHGPYQPLQPVHPRVPPAFPQQRIVNSFSPPAQLSNFPPQPPPQQQQFQSPPHHVRNPQRPQRLPITIQGLPEVQQRVPFSSFVPPHRVNINHPQQPGFPPTLSVSHQSVHLHNQAQQSQAQSGGFGLEQKQHQLQSYKQQEQEKQRYFEQRRHQELLKQREQQRLQEQQRQQEQQRHQEQQRIAAEQQRQVEQQRIVEQQRQVEQQRIAEQQRQLEQQRRQQQEQQYRQQYKFGQVQRPSQSPQQVQPQIQRPVQSQSNGGDILKAVPKLEQHYAIRENPLHPGPFPPNPVVQPTNYPELAENQFTSTQHQPNTIESQHFASTNQRNPFADASQQTNVATNQPQTYQNPQNFFAQNLPTPHQQHIAPQQPTIWGRPVFQGSASQKIYATPLSNSADLNQTPAATGRPSTTTASTTTTSTTTTTEAPTSTAAPKNEAKIKQNIANLPDEVPDDIREQLLSSGILGNADIQILDYDKVGDIPIENLPPEALANFYGAGGASAAASEPIPSIAKVPSKRGENAAPKKAPKVEQATLRPGGVEMKVVHFDPNTAQGQAIADQHIREDATRLDPVTIGARDETRYNRYLPLKVSGASFPIPDVPELNGKKISSVVVLAPVDYNFHGEREIGDTRQGRKTSDVQAVRFLAGESLKQLVKKPTAENYKKWLEQESRTEPQRQSVVLLVTTPRGDAHGEREIFMYDVNSQAVSKLSGELSTAFVDVAESNSDNPDPIDASASTY